MKKIIIIVALLIIVVPTSIFAYVYNVTMNSKESGIEAAQKRAKESVESFVITNEQVYYGDNKYFVFEGSNKDEEQVIVWVPEEEKEDVVIKQASEGLTKEEVRQYINDQYQPTNIVAVKLGMRNNVPLYEVTYVVANDTENYVYELLDFRNGDLLKKYTLKK